MNPLDTRPRTVALVALGPSKQDYLHAVGCKKDALRVDEVWLVNSLAGVMTADKVFIMDDLRKNASRYPEWGDRLKLLKTPIVTCHAYEEFQTSVEYPLQEVMDEFQDDWFSNSVAYALAYAGFIRADIYCFGADFFYPGSKAKEPGSDCCAYWLGRLRERGIKYRIPASSTLLDSHMARPVEGRLMRPLYGYDYNPGEMQAKAERGQATEHEKLLANQAPYTSEEPAA